jgi:hypothetical protein
VKPLYALPIAHLSDPDDLARASVRIERCRDRLGPVRSDPCEVLGPDEVDARLTALATELEVHGLGRRG